jgi:iron complex transport system ATP-binding protein
MRSEPFLEIDQASVYRGENLVFEGVSLSIAAGQNTVVLGPNGSGKTTLLKLLTRELHAVHAERPSVRLFGQGNWNVFELRKRFGVVSQDLQFTYQRPIDARSVVVSGFYASIGVHPHQYVSKAQIDLAEQALDHMGIAALAGTQFSHLSTGEQRRCLLARALVHDPEVLVLDEPTTGLDLKASFELLGILRSLAKRGKTLVLVTHHLEEVIPEITHAVLLKAGRVFAEGAKAEALTSDLLSRLFDVPLTVVEHEGFVRALPGG